MWKMNSNLIKKYNVAAPRYTSYPTVPYWDTKSWDQTQWLDSVQKSYKNSADHGISLYIHLPFCESLCTYCGCNTRITKNHAVEIPYVEAVLKEWDMYRKYLADKPKIREIHLGGGTPTFFSAENLKLLIEGILQNAEVVQGAEFSFEAHPSNTTYEHLIILYNLGFRRLSLGIQDFDIQVQEIINRRQTVEQVKQVTDDARIIGYTSINFDLIYGLPLQKQSSIIDTINKVNLMKPDRIAFYSYAHVPWIKPGQRKFTEADLPEDEEKRALYETGREMFLEAGYHEIGMDHFSLETDSLFKAKINNSLHRNFMGYTHQFTQLSIGLGVSSISDSWHAFAQNIKQVEAYLGLIKKGTFPLMKGHILTDEDLTNRIHILNIMCKDSTSWLFEDKSYSNIMRRLQTMKEDGLIEINNDSLTVTQTGKAFLRNVCMAFDTRLWENKPESQLFSMAV
jgi:oxygen-independent coproporphyrinogen III oxidase